jgi:DNA ligase 1
MPTFQSLCRTLQKIRETRGSNAKIALCSEYLRTIEADEDLNLAAQFIGEGAFSSVSGKRASVGSRTAGLAAASFCGIDYEKVFKPCRTATGSNSETIARLMENIPEAIVRLQPGKLSLPQVQLFFEELRNESSRVGKQECLTRYWQKMSPPEIKFSIRMLSGGSLRIGFETKSLTAAIASAFGCSLDEVRYAHMITGNIGKTAVLARNGELNRAQFRLFHPLSFMLASPVESRSVEHIHQYIAEEKFDGMRSQVHVSGEEVKIFSRDLNDVTVSFPEIVSFFREKQMEDTVLDGEICVWIDNTIQPFQLLQKRMGRKKPGKKVLSQYPVIFIAYDVLYTAGQPVFDERLPDRRRRLIQITDEYGIAVTRQFEVNSHSGVDELFVRALDRGNEGLMLKKRDSRYEYGQRGKSWLKVKKPGGSLDTVMMYAHAGSGRRGGLYSDFTFGISVKDDERYEEEFIPIGKAYGGYTDGELKKMNARIKELAVERYGPTLGLIPSLIVELEFDDIQENKRTKAGFTLRLPRFKAIRWDLGPNDADTLRDVERLYRKKN